MSGLLLAGDLWGNRVVNGVSTGWLQMGNALKCEVKENADRKDRPSKGKTTYGQNLDSVFVKKPADVSIELDEVNSENIALLWLGDSSDVSVAGASVTDEALTAKQDVYQDLANGFISTVVVQDATDTTTYVEGTDYELVTHLGMIKVLSGGSISLGDVLHIDYAYASKTSKKVTGGTNSSIKIALRLDGINLATQKEVLFNAWEAVLAPEAGIDLLSDDFTKLPLSGTLNLVDGKASPYEIETDLVSS